MRDSFYIAETDDFRFQPVEHVGIAIAECDDLRYLQGETLMRYGGKTKSAASMPTPENRAGISFQPALLGAGVLFSVFLNVIRFFPANASEGAYSLHPFMVSTGWGLVVCGVILAVWTVANHRAGRDVPDLTRPLPLIVGTVCTLAGMLFVLPLYANLTLPFVEPALFGIAFGGGLMLLASAWGTLFARLEPENLLFNSALSILLAAVLHVSAAPLSPSPWGVVFILCSIFASTALLAVARSTILQPQIGEAEPQEETSPQADSPVSSWRRARTTKAAAILWMPLVGACITCFIFGLTWDPIISSEETRLPDPLGPWKSLIGPALIAAIVAIIALRKADSSPLRLLNRAVYPIAVALLLALPVIATTSNLVAGIIDVLTQASFAVIALAIWCSMASAARSVPLAASLVFPACFAVLALTLVAGLCGIAVIGTDGRTICLVILTVYLALIAITFALGSRTEKENRPDARPADSRTYIHRRCDELSSAHALSPREREVLYYLGRGYNHGFVADKLYISENTVRTHVRHIYGKLGISSREELLELIDADTAQK